MAKIPILAIEKLMKKSGVERISQDSKEELQKILETYLYDLAVKASKIASHSGRKTIDSADLLIARE